MQTTNELINEFEQFIVWVEKLGTYESNQFFKPISNGKWSVSEILSHIMFWDNYICKEILSKMKQDADVKSIEFQVLNDRASAYALSGISIDDLIGEVVVSRKQLVSSLGKKSEEQFFARFTLNGEEIDQYSGYPHTLYNYISAFVWHDNHHKEQIQNFFNK